MNFSHEILLSILGSPARFCWYLFIYLFTNNLSPRGLDNSQSKFYYYLYFNPPGVLNSAFLKVRVSEPVSIYHRSKPLLIVHGNQRETSANIRREAEPYPNIKLFGVSIRVSLHTVELTPPYGHKTQTTTLLLQPHYF